MTHGFDLSREDHRLLRSSPPARALRWCAGAVGPGSRVVGVRALPGGTSSAVHAVDVEDGGGRIHALVLRRFVRADWLTEEPDVPRREAAALELMSAGTVPTPRLVALDADASFADVPAILMTRVAGAIRWRPQELEPFLRRLAAVLPEIHDTALPPDAGLPAYDKYALQVRRPPPWTKRPALWWRAFEVFERPAPAGERRLVHRDYHPGNVLWTGPAISGIVDWASTSVGSPDADVGHCRVNLAGEISLAAADRFLALHREITGRGEYDPWWDVAAALGGLGEDARWSPNDEEFLARAVAAAG